MKWMIATTRQLIAAAYFLGAVTALPAIAEEPNGIVVYESDFGLKDGAVSEMRAVAVQHADVRAGRVGHQHLAHLHVG